MKSNIEEFEINVDVSDRPRLYDYARGRYVRRGEDEGQEAQAAQGAEGQGSQGGSNMTTQIRAMDRAINFTVSEQEVMDGASTGPSSSASSPSNLPRRVLPIYHPGETIKGSISLKVKENLQADAIAVNFLGECVVNTKLQNKFGAHDETEKQMFMNKTLILWQKKEEAPGTGDQEELLQSDVNGDVVGLLAKGVDYTYPFEFLIQSSSPQSIPNLNPGKSDYCYVVWRLKAKITAGKGLTKREVVTHKGIWVENVQDITKYPELLVPLSTEVSLDTRNRFTSKEVRIKATTPSKVHCRGQNVPLKLEIVNQTSLSCSKIETCIRLSGQYKMSGGVRKEIAVSGAKCTTLDIIPGNQTLDMLIPWEFGRSGVDGNLLPTTLEKDEGNKCIDVQYDVMIKATRKGFHRNMELIVPLVVGNHNSAAQ